MEMEQKQGSHSTQSTFELKILAEERYLNRKDELVDIVAYFSGRKKIELIGEVNEGEFLKLTFGLPKDRKKLLKYIFDRGVGYRYGVVGEIEKIGRFIASGNLEKALKVTIKWVENDENHYFKKYTQERLIIKELTILQQNFSTLKTNDRKGLISDENKRIEGNRISCALLDIIENLKKISFILELEHNSKSDNTLDSLKICLSQSLEIGDEDEFFFQDKIDAHGTELLVNSSKVIQLVMLYNEGALEKCCIKKLKVAGKIELDKKRKNHEEEIKATYKEIKDQKIKETKENQATFLGLGGIYLKNFPEEIFEIESLKKIDLSRNRIVEFPEIPLENHSIEEINLRSNKLRSLPDSISNLKKLKVLILNDNNLKILPPAITTMKNLERLFLTNNKLEVLPENIGDLAQLQILQLADNKLPRVPKSLLKLTNLKEIRFNRLEPAGFSIMHNNIPIPAEKREAPINELIEYLVEYSVNNDSDVHLKHKGDFRGELLLLREGFMADLAMLEGIEIPEIINRKRILISRINFLTKLLNLDGEKPGISGF